MPELRKNKGLVWGYYTQEDVSKMREWFTAYLKNNGGIVRTLAKEIGISDQTLSAFILEGIQYIRLNTAIKLDKFMTSKGGKFR